MYCINCGVKLADTEKECPLCNTVVYHPHLKQENAPPLYPKDKIPKAKSRPKALNGMILILLFIPIFISLVSDLQADGELNWFGYVAGGLLLSYIAFGLPLWFQKPNPIIFVACTFSAASIYLFYINFATNSNWFLCFALPITGGFSLITCTVITLLYYLRKGRLYIFGGAFIALGALILLIEFLLCKTFELIFIGWSFYPFIVFALLGGLLIYIAANRSARELLKRKLFF